MSKKWGKRNFVASKKSKESIRNDNRKCVKSLCSNHSAAVMWEMVTDWHTSSGCVWVVTCLFHGGVGVEERRGDNSWGGLFLVQRHPSPSTHTRNTLLVLVAILITGITQLCFPLSSFTSFAMNFNMLLTVFGAAVDQRLQYVVLQPQSWTGWSKEHFNIRRHVLEKDTKPSRCSTMCVWSVNVCKWEEELYESMRSSGWGTRCKEI